MPDPYAIDTYFTNPKCKNVSIIPHVCYNSLNYNNYLFMVKESERVMG
jgi:hypothetical protein